MTFEPLLLSLTDPADVIRVGAQKINTNFSLIASSIEEAIQGIAYQNPVESISNVAPVEGIPLGSRYIIDFGILESDPWYGHIDEIAELSNDSPYEWIFLVPDVGWCLTVKDEDVEYLYNGEQWNSRPSVTQHNALSGIDGSTYHVSSDVYGALAGTGTPSAENKFVTADSLITDITTHTHDGEVTAQVDYGDLDNVPLTFAPTSHTHSKTDVTDFAHTHGKSDITDFAHAAGHIKGTGDEIDGDLLDIDFNPAYYTPGTVTETTHVDHLSSHLHGIDLAINGKSPTGHTHSYSAEDHDSTHITSGTDEIDGDKLDIDWNPSNYTPATVESYADSVDNLTAHLKGIDDELETCVRSDESTLPTTGEKQALVGSYGTAGTGNEYVTKTDPKLPTSVTTWTPTITWSDTAPGGTLYTFARYCQIGPLIYFWFYHYATDGDGKTPVSFTLPTTITDRNYYSACSAMQLVDTTWYPMQAYIDAVDNTESKRICYLKNAQVCTDTKYFRIVVSGFYEA